MHPWLLLEELVERAVFRCWINLVHSSELLIG